MAIPNGLTKVVVSGHNAGNAERWAFSLWFNGYGPWPDEDAFDPAGMDLTTNWPLFISSLCIANQPDFAVTSYDAYYYQGGVAVTHQQETVNHVGTGTGDGMPLQIACVMTLRTALSTRRGRGRIYLPFTDSNQMGANHIFASSNVNNCVDYLALYLSALQLTGDYTPVVVSQTGGTSNVITSVDADLVPDTQRRRANRLTSARHSSPVSPD